MSIAKLKTGRWRVRVYGSRIGREVAASAVLGLPSRTTWPTKREAKNTEAEAYRILKGRRGLDVTVREFHKRWTTDPLFTGHRKESTNLHNLDRTKAFIERYGDRKLEQLDDVVAEWLEGGKRNSTVPALRAMLNDAMSAKAGRLIPVNPFAGLRIEKGKGNKNRQPPSPEQMEQLVAKAHEITPPAYAAYLEFACCTGARPGELDALRWEQVSFEKDEVNIVEQWSAKPGKFDQPKYGGYTIALVARARQVLLTMKRDNDSPFVFATKPGTHFTPSSRNHHWNRVRCAVGLPQMTFYLATRHYFGWHALNVLELEPHIIAEQLGHKDGGKLVVQLYGHPDKQRARRLIREAYDTSDAGRTLRLVDGQAS